MTDRPIIFSAPMILALLAGRKTQTRRILQQEPAGSRPRTGSTLVHEGVNGSDFHRKVTGHFRPRWLKGDRLWVRENHAIVPWTAYRASEGVEQIRSSEDPDDAAIYAAGWERSKPRWRPSIHMPRWASRLTLVVTEVRVQRLQDISEADAIAEGLKPDACAGQRMWDPGTPHGLFGDPRVAFRMIWEDINGPESWVANPWVAAISFEVVRANIDAQPSRAA